MSVGFFGRFLGFYGASLLSTSCIFLSLLLSFFSFYEVALNGCFSYIRVASWASSEVLHVDWGFMFDSYAACSSYFYFFISSFIFYGVYVNLPK